MLNQIKGGRRGRPPRRPGATRRGGRAALQLCNIAKGVHGPALLRRVAFGDPIRDPSLDLTFQEGDAVCGEF